MAKLTLVSIYISNSVTHLIGLRQILRIKLCKRSNFPSSIRLTKMSASYLHIIFNIIVV